MVLHQLVFSSTDHSHGNHSEDTKTASADVLCCTRIEGWYTHISVLQILALTPAYAPFVSQRVPQQLLDRAPSHPEPLGHYWSGVTFREWPGNRYTHMAVELDIMYFV